MNDDDLVRELQHLPKEKTPPERVRAAVARELGAHRRRSRGRAAWRVAVAASLLAGAFLLGRFSAPARAPQAPAREFALLLYGGASDEVAGDRVSEYGAWAARVRREGRAVSGERLDDESWTVGGGSNQMLQGFFIVEARDAEDAQALARAHPHTKYGGTIVIRPVGR